MTELLVDCTDAVLRLTIDAPERLNAVDTPLVDALAEALLDHPDVRAAVLSGSGRAFSSGAKISATPNEGFLDAATRLVGAMTSARYPVVAAVDGPAAGFGCSIALAADLTVASQRSYFMLAFVKIGLMPDGGATALVAASVGRARAMRLAMLGEKLSAQQAQLEGLIAMCVPDDRFTDEVEALVTALSQGPTGALGRIKTAVNHASVPTLTSSLQLEHEFQDELQKTQDYREGTSAFKAKRQPEFRGR
ncbi:enoyl-CoA hydratase [Aeromicrobium panaciterrae]|uniref:enoyl-CoA hydratase-related protein n=1 Tax=Aeromicrobium panaciterrae TaxID=363861 RepID=UPI0031CF0296